MTTRHPDQTFQAERLLLRSANNLGMTDSIPTLIRSFSRDETASILGVTEKTLRNWESAKPARGPLVTKVGGMARYFETDLMGWLTAQREAALQKRGA